MGTARPGPNLEGVVQPAALVQGTDVQLRLAVVIVHRAVGALYEK